MADLPLEDLLSLETSLIHYMSIACMTILVYDWMCTLDQEECLTWYKLISCARYIITHHYMLILMLRTYAIWERRRGVLVFLIVLFLGTVIPAAVFWQIELNSTSKNPLFSAGCSIVDASPITIWAYLMVVISETGILHIILVVLIFNQHTAIVHASSSHSISLANMLLPILARSPLSAALLPSPQLVLHSVLCTRVLLFLRRQLVRGNTQDSLSLGINHTGLVFALGSCRDEQSRDIQ
ncbi:hypothetical protein DFH09DRAFT_1228543 [Mycena vulgaris]|nr:hypothetical protein DFH09DRAFT_1228543 [Mycena vulgaris]